MFTGFYWVTKEIRSSGRLERRSRKSRIKKKQKPRNQIRKKKNRRHNETTTESINKIGGRGAIKTGRFFSFLILFLLLLFLLLLLFSSPFVFRSFSFFFPLRSGWSITVRRSVRAEVTERTDRRAASRRRTRRQVARPRPGYSLNASKVVRRSAGAFRSVVAFQMAFTGFPSSVSFFSVFFYLFIFFFFYWASRGSPVDRTGFYLVLCSVTKLYGVLLGFNGFYWVSPSLTRFYWALPSFY